MAIRRRNDKGQIPPFEPTTEQRQMVEGLAALGIQQDRIGELVKIDVKTLRLHFRAELDTGMDKADAMVAQSLFRMATSGQNVAAAIFWLKARRGWKDRPVVPADETLTDDKLDQSIRLLEEHLGQGDDAGSTIEHDNDAPGADGGNAGAPEEAEKAPAPKSPAPGRSGGGANGGKPAVAPDPAKERGDQPPRAGVPIAGRHIGVRGRGGRRKK